MYVCWRGGWIVIPETREPGLAGAPKPPTCSPARCPGSCSRCGGLPLALLLPPSGHVCLCPSVTQPSLRPPPFLFLCLSTTQYYEMSYGLNIEMHKQVRSPHPLQLQTGGPGPLAAPQVQSGLYT